MKRKLIRKTQRFLSLLMHAFLGWFWCGTIMGLGQLLIEMEILLIIHVILGPLGVGLLAYRFYLQFPETAPLSTAQWITGIIIVLDIILVAPVFEQSFAMFRSFVGTWLPFALIFCAVYFSGHYQKKIMLTRQAAKKK